MPPRCGKKTCGRLSTLRRGTPKMVSCNAVVRRYDSGGGSSGHSLSFPTATWTRLHPFNIFQRGLIWINMDYMWITWLVGQLLFIYCQPSYTKSRVGGLHPIRPIKCHRVHARERNTSKPFKTQAPRIRQISTGQDNIFDYLPEYGLSATCQHM